MADAELLPDLPQREAFRYHPKSQYVSPQCQAQVCLQFSPRHLLSMRMNASDRFISYEFIFVSHMTDDEELRKRELDARIKQALDRLDYDIKRWKKCKDTILTNDNVDMLRLLAEKNIKGGNLSQNQREMKKDIHQNLRNAFFDIDRLITIGFMGKSYVFDPANYTYPMVKSKNVYDQEKIWKQDFPIEKVGHFIKALVEMFGDEYAIPLASAIEDGLIENQSGQFEIEVPIIKRIKSERAGL